MMAMLLAVAAMGSTGCVVTVHEGSYGGDHYRRDGWVKLGERMVNGQVDRDAILVGGSEGRFRRVVIVVENSSLEMYDMDIEFSNGTHFSPRLKRRFAEGARSQVIDLPGEPADHPKGHVQVRQPAGRRRRVRRSLTGK
jgi:hypothetical protein